MREDLVTFRDAGMPPCSMRAYVEDMLNELADMADRLNDLDLATAIRNAGVAGAKVGIGPPEAANRLRMTKIDFEARVSIVRASRFPGSAPALAHAWSF